MGYFFRRSAKLGPFRLNFSKSGIGASVGVKGARLTMTPRGTTYITVGWDGFYYRETLSNRKGTPSSRPAPPVAVSPIATYSSGEIATANVSELVDSSSETLIRRLNERAKMFNPAWMLYVVAVAVSAGVLVMYSASLDRKLPAVTSPLSMERKSNTIDEYSALVAHYGYPDSAIAAEPLGIVPVRTVNYGSARASVVLVPNGCVGIYDEVTTALAERSRYPELAERLMKSATRCTPSSNNSWTIVGYLDSREHQAISADIAKIRMDGITVKQTGPPTLEVESVPATKQKPNPRRTPKKQLQPKLEARSDKQIWTLRDQMMQDAQPTYIRGRYFRYTLLSASLSLFVWGMIVHKKNTEKRTSRLFYELSESEQQKYSIVQDALRHLGNSHRIWRIEGRSATSDWKRNAGASSLVRRVPIDVGFSYPPRVETNLAIPCINIGTAKLFFLPDVVLYLEGGTYGGIAYDDLRIEQHLTRFIEDEHVPADATIVDRRWRYVNKSGGPDRRFNNNIRLPVVQYGALAMTSSHGLNIHLNASNPQESLAFADCWRAVHSHIGRAEERRSEIPTGPDKPPGPGEPAFRVLGLNSDASAAEISAAYRRLAQMYHPDKVAGLAPEFQTLADQRMKEINAAYEGLKHRPQTGIPT